MSPLPDIILAKRVNVPLNIKAPLRWLLYFLTAVFFAALLAAIVFASGRRTEIDHLAYQRGAETVDEWNARRDAFLEKTDPASRLWQWLRPVPAQMPEAQITELPSDWVSRDTARRDFFKDWCSRPDTPKCNQLDDAAIAAAMKRDDFVKEFDERRETYLRTLTKPGLDKSNLTEANLFKAHLPGILLRDAILSRVNLIEAQMEGSDLGRAQLEGSDLSRAQLEGADLSDAQMEGANLSLAEMDGAILREAQMEGASLFGAQMDGAILIGAQMDGAILRYSYLTGNAENLNLLSSTNLSAVTNDGGALRFVDLSDAIFSRKTDFRNAFLDGSSIEPTAFAASNGNPCQWVMDRALSDDEFFGRWRGWIELSPAKGVWRFIAPEGFKDVTPIPPDDPDCKWKD